MVATLKISLDKEKPFLKKLLHGIHKKSLKLVKHLYLNTLGLKKSPSELKLKEAIDELHHGKEHKLIIVWEGGSSNTSCDLYLGHAHFASRLRH